MKQAMQIDQLVQLGPSGCNQFAYAQYGEFLLSWASKNHINICNGQHIVHSNQSGQMLASLWEHQLRSTEEWSHIQIGFNKKGNICFLCRVHENPTIAHEQIIQSIRMIEHAFSMIISRI